MTTTRVPLPHGGELTARQQSVLDAMRGPADVYVYGPPGTGKTTLLDAAHARNARSVRWHCAEFFRAVHSVRVVATSNYPPAQLLPNPLLHQAAVPVISRIEADFEVRELDDGVDHRRSSPVADAGFASGAWLPLVDHEPLTAVAMVNGRSLAMAAPDRGCVVETTFAELCGSPWPTADYLALLSTGESVVIHDVPDPARLGREPGQRLANLVDVAYDHDVPLIVHSGGGPERLHDADFPPLDVARTVSRLRALPRAIASAGVSPRARSAASRRGDRSA